LKKGVVSGGAATYDGRPPRSATISPSEKMKKERERREGAVVGLRGGERNSCENERKLGLHPIYSGP